MNGNLHPSRRSGFTLVEILVVLVILGLLAALLFPVFVSARKRAHMTVCISNLHQIGQAIQMYQADYEDNLPHRPFFYARQFFINGGIVPSDFDPLKPYTGVPAIDSTGQASALYWCPQTRAGNWSYKFRFLFDMAPDQHSPAFGKPAVSDPFERFYKHLRPGANTVIAFDDYHSLYDSDPVYGPLGPRLVLRQNGAVQRISENQIVQWVYKNGKWLGPPAGPKLRQWEPSPRKIPGRTVAAGVVLRTR